MVFCRFAARMLVSRILPAVADQMIAQTRLIAVYRPPVFINRIAGCHNVSWMSTVADSGPPSLETGLEIRKYLHGIGVDCMNIAKYTPSVFDREKPTVQHLIHILEQKAYHKIDVIDLIHKTPQILLLDQKDLEMRFELFNSIGLKSQDLITDEVRLLAFTDYFHTTKSNIQTMRELLDASSDWIRSLMKYKKVVFKELSPSEVRANIIMLKDLLLQHGCLEGVAKKVLLQAMRNDYRLFRICESQMTAIVGFLAEKDISGADLVYVIKKSANIFQLTPEQLEQRMQHLKIMLELSESEVRKFVIGYPRALGMKKENLDEHIDCFDEIDVSVSYIKNNPYVLWISVSEIKRRYLKMMHAGLFSERPTADEITHSLTRLNFSKDVFEKDMHSKGCKKHKSKSGKKKSASAKKPEFEE